jgi:hypothetical protein
MLHNTGDTVLQKCTRVAHNPSADGRMKASSALCKVFTALRMVGEKREKNVFSHVWMVV